MSSQTPRRQIIQTKAALEARAKRRNLIAVVSLCALALVAIVAIAIANRSPQSAATGVQMNSSIKVGDKAPNFSVSTTGGPFELAKDGALRPTMLEVFATWCPHCQHEAPLISAIAQQYKGRFNVVGVNGSALGMDRTSPETQADVVAWSQTFQATYPVAFDASLDVAQKYLRPDLGFPEVVLIGTDGKILAIGAGEMPPKNITKALDAVLAGSKPDPLLGTKAPGPMSSAR